MREAYTGGAAHPLEVATLDQLDALRGGVESSREHERFAEAEEQGRGGGEESYAFIALLRYFTVKHALLRTRPLGVT